MTMARPTARTLLAFVAGAALVAATAVAERKATFGDYAVHYSVFNTTFLQPGIAQRYGVARARDRALVNISVLDASGQAMAVPVTGSVRNLLGQARELNFRRFDEGGAIYFLATLAYEHGEALRFEIIAELPDSAATAQAGGAARRASVQFQQTLYWEE